MCVCVMQPTGVNTMDHKGCVHLILGLNEYLGVSLYGCGFIPHKPMPCSETSILIVLYSLMFGAHDVAVCTCIREARNLSARVPG
jgi:hypothetical protein